jgi:hypothetical protein
MQKDSGLLRQRSHTTEYHDHVHLDFDLKILAG